jgi:hypothetical protein
VLLTPASDASVELMCCIRPDTTSEKLSLLSKSSWLLLAAAAAAAAAAADVLKSLPVPLLLPLDGLLVVLLLG